jgi:hypothetical protein
VTKTIAWNHALRREIAEQRALIKRMDSHMDNGIMAGIRAERLELLEQLLRFEPEDQRGPLPDESPDVHAVPWTKPATEWPDIAAAIHAVYDTVPDGHKGCAEIALAAAREIESLRASTEPKADADEIERLRKERYRLRSALGAIIGLFHDSDHEAKNIARRVLDSTAENR